MRSDERNVSESFAGCVSESECDILINRIFENETEQWRFFAEEKFTEYYISRFASVGASEIADLIYECGLKEPDAVLKAMVNYFIYLYNPHMFGLDPERPVVDHFDKTAKVVIFLHGVGGGPYCFLDWAKAYHLAGIDNLYTVNLEQYKDDPVPLAQITSKINSIASRCIAEGADRIEISLQGHSLGALVSAKQIWRGALLDPRVDISMMVSIAGRLKYVENRFEWFCKDVRPEIEMTYAEYEKNPLKAALYTIWGGIDEIVPEDSVHIQGIPERELTVKHYGHLGIIFSDVSIEHGISWTMDWLNSIHGF